MQWSSLFAVLFLAFVSTGRAEAAETVWIGGNERVQSIEFRDVGNGTWEEYHNAQLKGRYTLEHEKAHYYKQLTDATQTVKVRLWGDWFERLVPGATRYTRVARGGWKGKFGRVLGVPIRYHGNYTGAGSNGGVPKDALDRAAQRHDIGYDRHGRMDLATDARFVGDCAAAAFNPFNDMSATGRIKALGAGILFTPKVVVDVPVQTIKKGVTAVKKGASVVKKGVSITKKKVGGAVKKVGGLIKKIF